MTLVSSSSISSNFSGRTSPPNVLSAINQQLHSPDQVTAYQNAHVGHSHTKILQRFASLRTFAGWSSQRFQSLHRRFHLRPCLQKMKSAATGPKGAPASGRIYSVPAEAKQSNVTSAPDTLIVSTNLKRDFGNTERSLRNVVHLEDVNALQVPYRRTDLCECSPEFKDLLYGLLCRFLHQWGVSL